MPIPQTRLLDGIDAWAGYVASDREPDPLVQLAIAHAEFEALHPFKDGNGRLGRMIIPLFLFSRRLLNGPNFYMSGYLKARRDEYIEKLRAISRDGDWTDWIRFFLTGIAEQASENQFKAQAILSLHQTIQIEVAGLTGSRFAPLVVDFLFRHPVFSSSHFVERAGVPRESSLRLLRILRDADILRTIIEGSGRRAGVYAFHDLLNIAEGRAVV